ncbi:MAG: LysM peptidoglycan-binding domain-containing protein [Caldilineaceae bacterium]|nr:LysM peptidoglycan-binding domain-containing protein [Caldilineaceae bacterium]
MARQPLSPSTTAERRCPNCGTRVARDAESCFMCGHDLRATPRRAQRVSFVDALLVMAVVAVLVVWWQIGSRPQPDTTSVAGQAILPGNVPLLTGTLSPTPEPLPTETPTPLPPTTTYIRHQVLTGETLLSISGEYDISVEEIQAVNNLDDELIRAGDVLIIPILQESSSFPLAAQGPASLFQYTVRTGDTIISIAVNFGSTVDEILRANNMTENDLIRPGDELTIPLRTAPAEVLESATTAVAETPEVSASAVTPGTDTIIYLEPQLIGPPDGSSIARTDELLFRWISVDILKPNEWYVLLIYPENGAAQEVPSVWTKSTSFRLGPEFAPAAGQRAAYAWQVSLVRVKTDADGQMILEAASPASDVRRLVWE